MRAVVELSDLIHYPFLKEAQGVLASRGIKVGGLSQSSTGIKYLDKACERVCIAIDGKTDYPEDNGDRVSDIITYVLARVLVSCAKDKRTTERFCRSESRRVYKYLTAEKNEGLKNRVNEELGVSFSSGNLPVIKYIELCSNIRDPKWRLINREVDAGFVKVSNDERDLLVSERIRKVLSYDLPMTVPAAIEKEFLPWSDKILAKVQEKTLAEFGTIDESAYPPCIQALIAGAAAGVNLTHSGRFSLVAFLNNIGMNPQQIEGIFARSPDYNAEMTEYQVNHISGNEYTTPSCATMLTHGVCVNKDKICEKSVHPLGYYRTKKKLLERRKLADSNKAKENKENKEEKEEPAEKKE